MDAKMLTQLLRATMANSAAERKPAEARLAQISKCDGFVNTILGIVMQNDLDKPVRQAAVVFLKNLVKTSWIEHDNEPGKPISFSFNEQDRTKLRTSVVHDIIHAPDYIKFQLLVCVNHIVKHDLPDGVTDINTFLLNPNPKSWKVALEIMYEISKSYKRKPSEERVQMHEAMNLLLPIMVNLSHDQSEQSVLLQKQILKIFYGMTEYVLPLDLVNKGKFSEWIIVCLRILQGKMPDCSHLTDDMKLEFPLWKLKKWAMRIILMMFERYGNPQTVISKKYDRFSQWFFIYFSETIISVLMEILQQYGSGEYISPRVLANIFLYLKHAVEQTYTWLIIKPNVVAIIQKVILPIMSFTDADQALWVAKPNKYVWLKFQPGMNTSLEGATTGLLNRLCEKHESILRRTILIITTSNVDNRQKEGAFHMIGVMKQIFEKEEYHKDLEAILTSFVFPELENPAGYLRASAWWVFSQYCRVPIYKEQILSDIIKLSANALICETELPIIVEAAVCLQSFLRPHSKSAQYIEYQIIRITSKILNTIQLTENDDLLYAMQYIIETFTAQLLSVGYAICDYLATKFIHMLKNEHMSDKKGKFAKLLLNLITTTFVKVAERPEVMREVQPIIVNVVSHIFKENKTDFYPENFSLVYMVTSTTAYPDNWNLISIVCSFFKHVAINEFLSFMPTLHNFVSVNAQAFLSDRNRFFIIFDLCKSVLNSNAGVFAECYAVKLLESIILEGKEQVDSYMPDLIDLILRESTKKNTHDFRISCFNVVIASLYNNPQLLFSIFANMSQPNHEPITTNFIKQWLDSIESFKSCHERKLSILGLCKLITLGDAKPPVLLEVGKKIMPAFIELFDGFKDACEPMDLEIDDEAEEEEDNANPFLDKSSESDEIYKETFRPNIFPNLEQFRTKISNAAYIESLEDLTDDESCTEEEDEEEDEIKFSPGLEKFKTKFDQHDTNNQYIIFNEVITVLSAQDQTWFSYLVSELTPEQMKSLQDIVLFVGQLKH